MVVVRAQLNIEAYRLCFRMACFNSAPSRRSAKGRSYAFAISFRRVDLTRSHFLSGTVGVGASGAFRLRPQSGAFGPSWGRPALFRPASRVGVRPSAARASSEYGWMRLWGNAKIGCSSMSRCGVSGGLDPALSGGGARGR